MDTISEQIGSSGVVATKRRVENVRKEVNLQISGMLEIAKLKP